MSLFALCIAGGLLKACTAMYAMDSSLRYIAVLRHEFNKMQRLASAVGPPHTANSLPTTRRPWRPAQPSGPP